MSNRIGFCSYFLLFSLISIGIYTLMQPTAGIVMDGEDVFLHRGNLKLHKIVIPDDKLDPNFEHEHTHHDNNQSSTNKTENPKDNKDPKDPEDPDTKPKDDPNNNNNTHDPKGDDPKKDPHDNKPDPKDPNNIPNRFYKIICPFPEQFPCNPIEYIFRFPIFKEDLTMIYRTSAFQMAGGIVANKNPKQEFLCRIKFSKFCNHQYPSEMLDRVFVIAPRYYIHQDIEPWLSYYHFMFIDYVKTIGLQTCVIEAIVESRNQHYEATHPNNEPYEIQTKIEDTFYIRENLLNVAAKKIIDHWDYMMWIDAHHYFDNMYWWEEAIWKMEHYAGVQFFQHLARLNEWNQTIQGLDLQATMYINSYGRLEGTAVWAGNAWGIRKELYNEIGYILDTCISGGCDYSYTMASMKDPGAWNGLDAFPHYKSQQWAWIEKTNKIFKGSGTYIRGYVRHFCHEHFFDYFGFLKQFAHCCFDIKEDLRRDDDWSLHLANQRMKQIFSKM